jgi:hypothetical protein
MTVNGLARAVDGEALGQPVRQATHGRRAVGGVQENIQYIRLTLIDKSLGKRLNKFAVTGNPCSLASPINSQMRLYRHSWISL